MARSNSSIAGVPLRHRLREWRELFRLQLRTRFQPPDFSDLKFLFRDYSEYLQRYSVRSLIGSRAVEIGYGARPRLLFWLAGMGVDVHGIDLDRPVLHGYPLEFLRIARTNGLLRAVKTVLRFVIADRPDRRALAKAVEAESGHAFSLPVHRLAVGNAAGSQFWERHADLDLIYSEDVFEHIPRADLETLLPLMARSLKPDGIAIVRPMVFTGLCGGHHVEWYPHTLKAPRHRVTEPWEHLRQDRYAADTYLNRLTRAEYRDLFSRHFEILMEQERFPGLGREFLTPAIRAELARFGEDELLSNSVLFILRPRRGSPS